MVTPQDALAGSLGIEQPAGPDGRPQRSAPQLFTAALLRAGRNGCTCECCKLMMAVADLMVDQAESPFSAQPAPAPEAPAAAPPQAGPPAASTQPEASPRPAEAELVNPDQPDA